MDEDKRVRIVFLGSGKTGKTNIIQQFLKDRFEGKYHPTVDDIFYQQFQINNQSVEVDIMDTSGSYNFPAMRRICICRAAAIVLVFSLDDPHSFIEVTELYDQVRNERHDFETTPIVVCSNKCDLRSEEHLVTKESIDMWKNKVNLSNNRFVTASAKTSEGVREIFEKLWQQNQQSKKIQFDQLPSIPEYDVTKRRSSAFAVLGSSSSLKPFSGHDAKGDRSPTPRSPRRLFKNTFSSHRRASTKITSFVSSGNKKGTNEAPKQMDCILS